MAGAAQVLVVAGSGLWWHESHLPWLEAAESAEVLEQQVEHEFRTNIREMLRFFLAPTATSPSDHATSPSLPAGQAPPLRVVLRLDYPGHDGCWLATQPLTGNPHQKAKAVSQTFHWDRMATTNHLAAAECEKHMRCDVLDASYLTSLRPDAHMRPVASGFGAVDCAHYCPEMEPIASALRVLAVLMGARGAGGTGR